MKVRKIWVKKEYLASQTETPQTRDSKGRFKELRKEILEHLTARRFVSFQGLPSIHYDNRLNCLWLFYGFRATAEEMFRHTGRIQVHAFRNWEIPEVGHLASIAADPFLAHHPKLQNKVVYSQSPAMMPGAYRTVQMGHGATGVSSGEETILPLHPTEQPDILDFLLQHALKPLDVPGIEGKLRQLYGLSIQLQKRGIASLSPAQQLIQEHLLAGDYFRARLPVLEPAYLQDSRKGLWELHQPQPPAGDDWVEVALKEAWEARNPEVDIRSGVVAIDFGTSSTVVACREHGKTTLLRVGMSDFFRKPTPEDYQNPTVLEFIHLPNLLAAWNAEPYRPLTRWEDLRFAHDALADLKENPTDQRIVASIFSNLKQWPLTATRETPLRLADQKSDFELLVPPFKVPEVPKGQPLVLAKEEPFNPIELYAYYLGLFINHRENGLFLEYYMTFPITYPREVKERIRSAFARGLQRSLPASLATSPKFARFHVTEEASEPAAYAACALEELRIRPTDEGTPFAVFDFGGGTTDFDFGVYRYPTSDEEDQGYEAVLEHYGASGETYLGGENLIANLAYLALLQNLELCRQHHLPFVCPPDAQRFPGHEFFLDQSHVAQTNSALVKARVREVWEAFLWSCLEEEKKGKPGKEAAVARPRRKTDFLGDALRRAIVDGQFRVKSDAQFCPPDMATMTIALSLLNRDRKKVEVALAVDRNQLTHYLVERVGRGIHHFFLALTQAFADRKVDKEQEVHVLLAGNASRSPLVQGLFAALLQERMAGWTPPSQGDPSPGSPLSALSREIPFSRFVVHRPPPGDPNDLYRPTAKTGVAIGLLKLIPGETLLALGPSGKKEKGEAPFLFNVGRFRREVFQPILAQGATYGEWRELGKPIRGAFVLVYTTSPVAAAKPLSRGAEELLEWVIRLPLPEAAGKTLFVQAAGPDSVEVCLADSVAQIQKQPERVAHAETIFLR